MANIHENPQLVKYLSEERIKLCCSNPALSQCVSGYYVLKELENLHINIKNRSFDECTRALITYICNLLKSKGSELETTHKEQLDDFFATLQNAKNEEMLDTTCKQNIDEVVKLRELNWKNDETDSKKLLEDEEVKISSSSFDAHTVPSGEGFGKPDVFGHQASSNPDISKSAKAGKYISATQLHYTGSDKGIKYYTDPGGCANIVPVGEPLRPNGTFPSNFKSFFGNKADGNAPPVRICVKHDGLYELPNTMTNLPKRNIYAKPNLMQCQINSLYPGKDDASGIYSKVVINGSNCIYISGVKEKLVNLAKIELEKFYAEKAKQSTCFPDYKKRQKYCREFLLKCCTSPHTKNIPHSLKNFSKIFPFILVN